MLAAKLEAGAATAHREPTAPPAGDEHIGYPKAGGSKASKRSPRAKPRSGGTVQDIMTSPMARDLVRTAAREIVRGVFGVGRRR